MLDTVDIIVIILAIFLIFGRGMISGFTPYSPEFIRQQSLALANDPPSDFANFTWRYPWADTVFYYDLVELRNSGKYTPDNIAQIFHK